MARKEYKYNCKNCNKDFYFPYSYNSILGKRKQYCSKSCYIEAQKITPNGGWFKKGIRLSIKTEFKKGNIPWDKGIERPEMSGKNHWNWQGGIEPIASTIRRSIPYKRLRLSAFERDKYICQMCKQRGGKLQIDHILPFSLFPDKILDLNNVRTLCKSCHLTTPTFGGRVFNYGT